MSVRAATVTVSVENPEGTNTTPAQLPHPGVSKTLSGRHTARVFAHQAYCCSVRSHEEMEPV